MTASAAATVTIEQMIEAVEAMCCTNKRCKKCAAKRAAAATLRELQKGKLARVRVAKLPPSKWGDNDLKDAAAE